MPAGEMESVSVPAQMLPEINRENKLTDSAQIYDFTGNRRGMIMDLLDDGTATVVCMNQHINWFKYQAARFRASAEERILTARYTALNQWELKWDFLGHFANNDSLLGRVWQSTHLHTGLADVAISCGITVSEIDYLIRPRIEHQFEVEESANTNNGVTTYQYRVVTDSATRIVHSGTEQAIARDIFEEKCRYAHIAIYFPSDREEVMERIGRRHQGVRIRESVVAIPKLRPHRTIDL